MRKLLLATVATLSLSGCGYNDFQRLDEGVKAAWSEVLNNFQRRADLIPNLVATVQGAADFEKSTLVEITNARASVSAIKRRRNSSTIRRRSRNSRRRRRR
jgi:LemA protein